MAKQLHRVKYSIEVIYSGGTQSEIRLSDVNYSMCETTDSALQAHAGLHTEDNVPRILDTTSGLADTVQDFTDDLETEIKTKEGI